MKNDLKIKGVECALIFAALIVLGFLLENVFDTRLLNSGNTVSQLSEGWYYMEDGEPVRVTLPADITLEDSETLILYNDSISRDTAGKMISTRGSMYRLTVSLDKEILYEYQDEEFPRNEQMASKLDCSFLLPENTAGKTLVFTYSGNGGTYRIRPVYIGNGERMFLKMIGDHAITLTIVFFMIILGVAATGVSFYLRHIRMRDWRFLNTALFLLLCAVWIATDSSLVQVLCGMSPVVNYISFFAFMFLGVPILHFVRNTGEMSKYKSLDICILAFYINAVVQGLLNYFGLFDLIDLLFVTHLLLVAGIVEVVVLLTREYRREKNKEIGTILVSFTALAFSGAFALALYWMFRISFYDLVFECGILLFILFLFCRIIITAAENVRFKTEMIVYQRLAKEDRLTGLKNRRAFDEYMDNFARGLKPEENAALMFLDLNNLKRVNDNYGHTAGDELIIGVARVLERAFAARGECFRLSGDEFCVVISDLTDSLERLNERLDGEIGQFNTNSRYKLSVARGCSYLRDDQGNVKTISEWKYEADQQMYKNKGWHKENETGSRG